MIASANSAVPTAVGSSRRAFRSYVTSCPSAITEATAVSRRAAASDSPMCSSISLPERIIAVGFTLFWPLYFGAEPCVASKTGVSPDIGAGRDAETADEARGEIADDVAVEVREDEHVELLGPLD